LTLRPFSNTQSIIQAHTVKNRKRNDIFVHVFIYSSNSHWTPIKYEAICKLYLHLGWTMVKLSQQVKPRAANNIVRHVQPSILQHIVMRYRHHASHRSYQKLAKKKVSHNISSKLFILCWAIFMAALGWIYGT
jgi:hypothetical protein